jgi:hypothetical protein
VVAAERDGLEAAGRQGADAGLDLIALARMSDSGRSPASVKPSVAPFSVKAFPRATTSPGDQRRRRRGSTPERRGRVKEMPMSCGRTAVDAAIVTSPAA